MWAAEVWAWFHWMFDRAPPETFLLGTGMLVSDVTLDQQTNVTNCKQNKKLIVLASFEKVFDIENCIDKDQRRLSLG